ncbi:MAG: hypothetical protein WDN30_04915 [Pararobbsia sp.]
MTDDEDYKGVFDISDAEGINDSERLLFKLCRKSFLSLWAHANLHTDQDMREGKGSAKEFADVLVVFGDDVIIFSDKHVPFQTDRDLQTAWARWYKRAVTASAKQLHGAMGWLRRFPVRVFLDSKCTRPLPVQIPPVDRARYHLVAVTRGSVEACAASFPGSFGTHQIRTDLEGRAHESTPFTIGVLDRSKHFVHVFDEFSLEVLMNEMDTITDFVLYLQTREPFIVDQSRLVVAAGEEQLVALYLTHSDNERRTFLPTFNEGEGQPDFIMLDESHYPALLKLPEYLARKKENARSRVWDELVERFIRLGDPTLVMPGFVQANEETEKALRIMAAEPRFRRRVFIEAMSGLIKNAMDTPTQWRARVITTPQAPLIVYIFLTVPQGARESDDEYRRHRASVLHAYVRCAKLKFPAGQTFIGIGFDHPARVNRRGSEDLIIYNCGEFTDEERAKVEEMRRDLGILPDESPVNYESRRAFPEVTEPRWAETDYPEVSTSADARLRAQRRAKAKAAKASRKRNARR